MLALQRLLLDMYKLHILICGSHILALHSSSPPPARDHNGNEGTKMSMQSKSVMGLTMRFAMRSDRSSTTSMSLRLRCRAVRPIMGSSMSSAAGVSGAPMLPFCLVSLSCMYACLSDVVWHVKAHKRWSL